MRKILFIFALMTIHIPFGLAQSTDVLTLTFQSGIKLRQIPEPGGQYSITQLCTDQIDSIITNGNVKFIHSKVGRVRDCLFEYQIRNDTLVAVTLETYDSKQTERLHTQVLKQYGDPTDTSPQPDIIYQYAGPKITAELYSTEDRSSGKLVVRRK